jgi:anaphase-promoting complex subunit 1
VRWACMGKLEQSSSGSPCLNGAAFGTHAMPERSSYSSDHPSKYSSFGPFWEWRSPLRERPGQTSLLVAVYIFLRTSLRIFLLDGTDFTVSLPFTVRKAWPLWPHGVMMQRYVDKRELDEAEVTGEYLLPSLFTLTSPLVELSSVGLTKGIVGRPGSSTLVLEDETELLNHTLESVDATETVIHVGDHLSKSPETIVVTIEVETCRLSVWSYVYIPPMGIPEPLRSDQNPQSRDSNATTSELPFLRSSGTNEQMTSRGQVSASSTTSSLAAMLANIKTDFLVEGEAHGALNTSMRHDSVAAAHLGDATDHVSEFQVPEDHGRMKAACWMECLHTEDITPHE